MAEAGGGRAHEVLSNAEKRREYDKLLFGELSVQPPWRRWLFWSNLWSRETFYLLVLYYSVLLLLRASVMAAAGRVAISRMTGGVGSVLQEAPIATSGHHTVAFGVDFGRAFGRGDDGQLGAREGPITALRPSQATMHGLPAGVHVSAVVTGLAHTVVLSVDGAVWACGRNTSGQLGLTDKIDRNQLTIVCDPSRGADPVAWVTAGHAHTVLVTVDGEAFGTGSNEFGQIGQDTDNKLCSQLSAFEPGRRFKLAAAGNSHTALLCRSGCAVWACGRNNVAQCGGLPSSAKHKCVAVEGLPSSGIQMIAAGGAHNVAATSTAVYGWGENRDRQISGN